MALAQLQVQNCMRAYNQDCLGSLQFQAGKLAYAGRAHLALLLPVLQALLLQQGKGYVRGHHAGDIGANWDGSLQHI